MQVGDLIKFPETNYTGLILEFTDYDHVLILVTEDVPFKNPTWMTKRELKRCAEVISATR